MSNWREIVRQLVEAYDSGNLQMNSAEIGEPENDIPIHPWHEEFLHNAREALRAPQAATPTVGGEALETLIREYARDLRRNSSGGDDYPWEIMKGVADYLGILIERSHAAAPQSATPAVDGEELREAMARVIVPYGYGTFENQERWPDGSPWKYPPGTPNARAYELADELLALAQSASPLRGMDAVIKECAEVSEKIAKRFRFSYGADTTQSAAINLVTNAIRTLSSSPPEQPVAALSSHEGGGK